MRVVTQAQPGFCGKCTCGMLYGTPPTQYITPCSPGTAVVSAPSLVPELAGWLPSWLGAWQCSCQRQSLLLGSAVSRYGDLARTKMGAKTHA